MGKTLIATATSLVLLLPGVVLANNNGGGGNAGANSNGNYATKQLPSQRIVNSTAQGQGAALVISGAGVREVQQALNRLGYQAGPISGSWDRETVRAMRNFQGAHGLEPTGNLDISSIAALGLWKNLIGNPLGNGNQALTSNTTGAPPPRGSAGGGSSSSHGRG